MTRRILLKITVCFYEEFIDMTDTNKPIQNFKQMLQEAADYLHGRNLNEASALAQEVIRLSKASEDYETYTRALNTLGVIQATLGNEGEAIDCYLAGLKSAQLHHLDQYTHLFYNNIGSRYQEYGDHATAIHYFLLSEKELESEICLHDKRYTLWRMINCMNILLSCNHQKDYVLGEKYLNLTESLVTPELENSGIMVSLRIIKFQLYWNTGRKEYVYEHLDSLIQNLDKVLGSDFLQNMYEVCSLLRDMNDFTHWRETLAIFQKYADEQNSLFFHFKLSEFWLDYYDAIGDTEQYTRTCVEHTKLYLTYQKALDEERIDNVTQKIVLQQKEEEREKAEIQSKLDPLTGLGNRYLLDNDFDSYMASARKNETRLCLAITDIDFFKQHNDTYGHIHGDACLKEVASILKECVGEHGSVYRFGGDEFVILLTPKSTEEVKYIAESIREALTAISFPEEASGFSGVTVSQGYALSPLDMFPNKNALLAKADQALYSVKRNGRNHYSIYEI